MALHILIINEHYSQELLLSADKTLIIYLYFIKYKFFNNY